jgi:pimeloyl-ACP methyl ester carboxylesterase
MEKWRCTGSIFVAFAALFFLASCAAQTPEPRLPRTTAAAETRNALLAAGLRPGTIEGPRGTLLPAPSDEELDALVNRVAAGPAPRLFAGLRAEDFLDTKAAEIRVPVELVWGEEDGVLPLDYGRRLASLLPRARLHPLPRCGHMPQVHCPRELSRLLLDLLAAPPQR